MRILFLITFTISVIFISCHSNNKQKEIKTTHHEKTDNIRYAQGFSMSRSGKITILKVFNPWEGASNVEFQYLLCPEHTPAPDSLKHIPVITTPVKRMICLSTSHIAMLSFLHRLNTLVGLSGTGFVSDTLVKQMVQDGKVSEVGYDQSLNYELMVSLKPDVVMAYGIGSETSTQFKKLEELGIKVVLNGDYLESHPLGKLEWVKFMAAFYGLEDETTARFDSIATEYEQLTSLCDTFRNKPKVLSGLPWKGPWFVPGGDSYAARLIHDAGGNYLWKDVHQRESLPLNFEEVINRANQATIWINCGSASTLSDIVNVDERLAAISSYKAGEVYNNNLRTNASGGNDFWESGLTHPQVILRDLIKIFHPEVLPHHRLVYYQKLH